MNGYLPAAENTATGGDTNSRVIVENAIVKGNETTVFFLTHPDIGDPNAGKPCPLNYYSVTLKPGLPVAKADVVAKGVCSGLLQKSSLLNNGDALMIVGDRLERWRAKEQISSQPFSSIDTTRKLRVSSADMGAQFYDISPQGDVVLAVSAGGFSQEDFPDSAMVITSLGPDGQRRWEVQYGKPAAGAVNMPNQVWAGSGGGALFYTSMLASGLAPSAEAQLHFVSAGGSEKLITLNETGKAMDFHSMGNMSPQDLQKIMQQQGQSRAESIKNLAVAARTDGDFDVLLQREGGGDPGRKGFFLYRIGSDGTVGSEVPLGNHIKLHGLERWFDFYVEGKQLVLLSKAPVTQKVVGKVKKKWGQNIVSWIDLDTGIPTARLIPLDERYLEAAMNAGDEGQQHLDGHPGSTPVLLTKLGGNPLVVSVAWMAKRQVVRLHEAHDQLMLFTEIVDERQAKLARETSRKQRSAGREAQARKVHSAMAAAAGMSEEEFGALSNAQRKKALIRSGNSDQLLESMMRESQALQAQQGISAQGAAQQQAGNPRDMSAQIAAAMAQAQAQLDNDPNITPEMRAQMAAIMAQVGQGPAGQGTTRPTMPGAQIQVAAAASANKQPAPARKILQVDAAQRGSIEYVHKNQKPVTLLIFNRQTGEELLKKDYPDGVIYEYIDFSRFKLPLERIGVTYREAAGVLLEDLAPVITP